MTSEIPKCACGGQMWQRYDLMNPLSPIVCTSCSRELEAALKAEDDDISFLDGENVGSTFAVIIGDALMRGVAAKMAETRGEPFKSDGVVFFLGAMLKALGKSMDPTFQPDNHTSRLTVALHETLSEVGPTQTTEEKVKA